MGIIIDIVIVALIALSVFLKVPDISFFINPEGL